MNEGEPQAPRGLVIVADGVGGLDLCGIALTLCSGCRETASRGRVRSVGPRLGPMAGRPDGCRQSRQPRSARGAKACGDTRPSGPWIRSTWSPSQAVRESSSRHSSFSMSSKWSVSLLLAPALSPAYDLSNALRAVRREMVVFWSPLDVIILGAGTRVFGTIDRVKTASAGLVGFRVPAIGKLERQQRPAIRQTAPDPLATADGGHRLPGRTLRAG